ncbi:hypothetical protein D3C59_17080 [Streptomyces sp. SHP22-7]|nr:hypothetical protein D3C59_17080 [Streptomyces sp. SHP22-7]GGZ73179.1 hypothetical protein GCM10010301_53420 [Streptomyces plicatus]GHC27833.1 hypothetical protein GCM10010308_51130 [Streptomyces vinaceusdrappus]
MSARVPGEEQGPAQGCGQEYSAPSSKQPYQPCGAVLSTVARLFMSGAVHSSRLPVALQRKAQGIGRPFSAVRCEHDQLADVIRFLRDVRPLLAHEVRRRRHLPQTPGLHRSTTIVNDRRSLSHALANAAGQVMWLVN